MAGAPPSAASGAPWKTWWAATSTSCRRRRTRRAWSCASSGAPSSSRTSAGSRGASTRPSSGRRTTGPTTWPAPCPDCGRIVLLRVMAEKDDPGGELGLVNEVLPTLEDHPREGQGGQYWSVYGLTFHAPEEFQLTEKELKSGHLKLIFEKDGGRPDPAGPPLEHGPHAAEGDVDRRLVPSSFFRKDLRDVNHEVAAATLRDGHRRRARQRPAPEPLAPDPAAPALRQPEAEASPAGRRVALPRPESHLHRRAPVQKARPGRRSPRPTHGRICLPRRRSRG